MKRYLDLLNQDIMSLPTELQEEIEHMTKETGQYFLWSGSQISALSEAFNDYHISQ